MDCSIVGSRYIGRSRDWMNLVEDYDNIRSLMSEALDGFEDYNKRVRQPNGFALPTRLGQ